VLQEAQHRLCLQVAWALLMLHLHSASAVVLALGNLSYCAPTSTVVLDPAGW
jgi:hypothetical protein